MPESARMECAAESAPPDVAARIITELTRRRETVAVAESLTGGLLVAALVAVPGASAVVSGGVVAYNTAIKHSVLGVDVGLLAQRGAVDPDVARQMADGVRRVLAVGGRAADYGIATTGVAGPDPQDGQQPGTVYIGIAGADGIRALSLDLTGDRAAIREGTVQVALAAFWQELQRRQRPESE